ncbi:ebs-bah-phd domain-containing protein [Zymoseptoria brevis]|uniref:Ebs-bah-phd domain-containing protein n=1 Tax=Zymoseptoria brevis TaxID=1047168 RepID=A0A0F4G767_9PEZI|nr:ebs-bah-phd domain-containing protein [Zymoseptoria brevis]
MRTKQTGKKAKQAATSNGTPAVQTKQTASDNVKSPNTTTQPPELTEAEKSKLKAFLEKQGTPFTVSTAPASRKRKRDAAAVLIQDDLWEDRLSVQYEVKPKDKWDSLRRYKKFTVGSESIATGQCILVKADESDDAKIDVAGQWKAKVLEVRALDSEHVFIRVAWLNRPEDLPTGRKSYHGKNELIPTNQMDVIDAMAVNGSLDVRHWDDKEDDSAMMEDDQYFWRQTLDHTGTRTYSKLRLICIDSAPQNPDQLILQCSDPACRKWLHVKCIAERAAQRAADETSTTKKKGTQPAPKKRGRPKNLTISATSPAVAKASKGTYTAEVFLKGLTESPQAQPATHTEIIISGPDGEPLAEELCCLFCDTPIEDD